MSEDAVMPSNRMTLRAVAKLLDLSESTTRRLADSGALGAVERSPGGHRRLNRGDVEAYANRGPGHGTSTLKIRFGAET